MRSKFTALIGASESSELIDVKFTVYVILTLFLCLTDAIMTLALLRMGAWEANPVMRAALEIGPKFFIFAKYFLTASGLIFLIRNSRIRIFFGMISLEEIAGGLILFYEGLIIYEVTIYHLMR